MSSTLLCSLSSPLLCQIIMSTALDLAVTAYHAQQDLRPKDQRSLCSFATQFGVSTTSVSDQVTGRHLPSKVTHFAEQALIVPGEVALVEYIKRMSLSGLSRGCIDQSVARRSLR